MVAHIAIMMAQATVAKRLLDWPLSPQPLSLTEPMTNALYMDAVITPNRSLPKTGFWVLMGILLAANLIIASLFLVMGAPFVPVFLGIDVLGVWIAFRISYRHGQRAERVQVSPETVSVFDQVNGRSVMVWRSPTAFTGVDLEDLGDEDWAVRLKLSGQRHTVARMLSPTERLAFGQALQTAIRSARAERYPVPWA